MTYFVFFICTLCLFILKFQLNKKIKFRQAKIQQTQPSDFLSHAKAANCNHGTQLTTLTIIYH